jgi:hypothetical protein
LPQLERSEQLFRQVERPTVDQVGAGTATERFPASAEPQEVQMRRRLLGRLTGLTLSASLFAPAAAFAAETETIHFSGTEARVEVSGPART